MLLMLAKKKMDLTKLMMLAVVEEKVRCCRNQFLDFHLIDADETENYYYSDTPNKIFRKQFHLDHGQEHRQDRKRAEEIFRRNSSAFSARRCTFSSFYRASGRRRRES